MSTKKMQIIGLKGKSAYQYAQDGGYAGTEAEFKEKMASELEVTYDYENLNEAILATAIKPEASGEFIHITDSAALPIMEFGMEGKTEQETTSGKNLYSGGDVNGLGQITIRLDEKIPSGTYVFSAIITSSDTNGTMSNVSFRDDDMKEIATFNLTRNTRASTSFTIPIDTNIIVFYASSNSGGSEGDTFSFKDIQIEAGSTATDYEPYTGAQPSPNPDYPQEIINAGTYNEATGRYEIGCSVVNKNLFDLKAENVIAINTSSTKTSVRDIDNGIELSYTNARNSYVELNTKLLPNTTYSISCNIVVEADQTQSTGFKCINVYDNNDRYYGGNIANVSYIKGKNTFSFTTPSNTDYVKISLVGWSLVNGTTGKTTFTDFILSVDGSTEFLPHQATEFILTSPVPLTKWDKLVKRDGVWGWSVWSESINAKEKTINIVNYLDETSGTVNFDVPNAVAKQSSGIYCNRAITGIVLSGYNNKFRIYENSIQIRLEYPEGITRSSSNADMITAYMNLFNAKEYIFQYQTAQEQSFHPLPDSEQALLRSLETYYQVTNIYNDQNCPMSIQYIADTQTYVDNLTMSLTNAVVSLGGEV